MSRTGPVSPRPLSHANANANQGGPSSPSTANKLRASVAGGDSRWHPSQQQQQQQRRGVSPGRASTGGGGGFASQLNQSQGVFHSAETEAIDRWFEDLSHYEATLEEMAAASLDTNFKEELSAIEQWFRVLSEAERTAALYSLLQSATQMQMRFLITVLQQMARSDPTQQALLSPANPNPSSCSLEHAQSTRSPSSPMMRQFARSSLGPPPPNSEAYLSPNPNSNPQDEAMSMSLSPSSTLAAQRAKLKASARTSAPANLLLGGGAGAGMGLGVGGTAGTGEGLKSPLWSKDETVTERSPSPRPKSTGSTTGRGGDSLNASNSQSSSSAFLLRSPALDHNETTNNQLSPLVGGNWASMVNTPLVPMFGKNGETMEPGNYGGNSPNPNLDSLGQRLGSWQQQQQQQQKGGGGGIVLDDVRKFRRSARVSGGALSGMYEGDSIKENNSSSSSSSFQSSAATAQKRVQDQLNAVQQLKNMQQSALSLGLGSLPSPGLNGSTSSQAQSQSQQGGGSSRVGSSGALNSPGLQQTAMQAQQNWRMQNAPQLAQTSSSSSLNNNNNHHQYNNNNSSSSYHSSPNVVSSSFQSNQLAAHGNNNTNEFGGNIGLGTNLSLPSGLASPTSQQQQQAQQQLASLIALQQQMMQQQQQLQTLAGLSPTAGGLGVGIGGGLGGLGMMGTGANLSPNMAALAGQMLNQQQQQQISPRLGGGGGHQNNNNNYGLGMGMGIGGMPSPRRSPRPHHGLHHHHDRSPTSYAMTSHRSGNSSTQSSQQLPQGSGSNPDEPLDFALLGDTAAWLRSLRLHKYTQQFDGVGWKDMVRMSDDQLEKRGVSALGARRKLTK